MKDSFSSNDISESKQNKIKPIFNKLVNRHNNSKKEQPTISNNTPNSASNAEKVKDKELSLYDQALFNKKYLISYGKYLEYDELFNLKQTNKELYSLLDKDTFLSIIKKGSISANTRKHFWKNNINLTKVKTLVWNELKCEVDQDKMYSLIIERMTPKKTETKGVDKNSRPIKTPFAKTVEEISRDLGRTFHEGKFTTTEFLCVLERILCSISYIRPEVGYCQGMNFVAAAILELLDDEELSFWIFLNFLDDMELNSLYYENMTDYSIRIYQLNHYIKKEIPSLYAHFQKNQINPDLILSKWILTIFSSYLPFSLLSTIWDIFIFDGWKAIISFSLIFLYMQMDKFIAMDLQKISKYIRENSRKEHICKNESLDLYDKFKLSNEELDELREEYFKDLALKKIDSDENDNTWENDQLEALEIYKVSLKKLTVDYKDLLAKYKSKVEHYDKLYKMSKDAYVKVNQKTLGYKLNVEELIEHKSTQENLLKILNKKEDKKEISKVNKKITEINKKIADLNKELLEQYGLLDDKKTLVDKIKNKAFQYRTLFEETMRFIKSEESKLVKQLSERLKLSEKFVRTSKF